jgi:hypothetical protein
MRFVLNFLKRLFSNPEPPPAQPDPPPPAVPLDQTTAPLHFEGDTSSV